MSKIQQDVKNFVNAYAKLTPLRHKLCKDLMESPKYKKLANYNGGIYDKTVWSSIINESSKIADVYADPKDNKGLNARLLNDLNLLDLVKNPRLQKYLEK